MLDAPKQNWRAYDDLTRRDQADWVRSLSLQDRFAIYDDLFNMIWLGRQNAGDWERLEKSRWKEKVARRLELVRAFVKLDQLYGERATANNPR